MAHGGWDAALGSPRIGWGQTEEQMSYSVSNCLFLCMCVAGGAVQSWPDALVSAGGYSSQVLLVATADPSDRTVLVLDRDGAAAAISAIISVGAITSIVFVVVTRLRAHSHASQRSVNANLR